MGCAKIPDVFGGASKKNYMSPLLLMAFFLKFSMDFLLRYTILYGHSSCTRESECAEA